MTDRPGASKETTKPAIESAWGERHSEVQRKSVSQMCTQESLIYSIISNNLKIKIFTDFCY